MSKELPVVPLVRDDVLEPAEFAIVGRDNVGEQVLHFGVGRGRVEQVDEELDSV